MSTHPQAANGPATPREAPRARVSNMSKRSRNWQFTMNYYTYACIEHLLNLTFRGIIFQEELTEPSEKNQFCPVPHLQGFIRFNSARLGSDVKAMFCTGDCDHSNTVHLEVAHHPCDLVEYCRKGETRAGECYEEGDMEFVQGQRNDWDEVINFINEGHNYSEVLLNFPRECLSYDRAIQRIIAEAQRENQPAWRRVQCYVLLGPPGFGKTRLSYEFDPSLYQVTSTDANGTIWFDDYKGQKTLLLDDFYGWIPYHSILRILDGHPIRLPIKGGHCYPCWTTVIITSNKHPHDWYYRAFPGGASPALCRRLNTGGVISCDTLKYGDLLEILRKGQRLLPVVSGALSATSPNYVEPTGRLLPALPGIPGLRDLRAGGEGLRVSDSNVGASGSAVGQPCALGLRVEVDLCEPEGPGLEEVQRELEAAIDANEHLEASQDMC